MLDHAEDCYRIQRGTGEVAKTKVYETVTPEGQEMMQERLAILKAKLEHDSGGWVFHMR